MAKVLVVVEAPYSVPDSSGHHLVPGEIAEIEDTPLVRSRINDGQLSVVTMQKHPEPPPAAPEPKPAPTATPAPSPTKTRASDAQKDQES